MNFIYLKSLFITWMVYLDPTYWLVSSVGRALHRYRRGHGFKSRTALNFFQILFSTTSSVVFLAARISKFVTVILFIQRSKSKCAALRWLRLRTGITMSLGRLWCEYFENTSGSRGSEESSCKDEPFFFNYKHNTYNTIWNTTCTNYNAYLHYSTYSH